MARKEDYSEEDMRKRSTLNLDQDGFATKKTPGNRPIDYSKMSKTAMKGKDDAMKRAAARRAAINSMISGKPAKQGQIMASEKVADRMAFLERNGIPQAESPMNKKPKPPAGRLTQNIPASPTK